MATRGLKPVVEIQFFDYIWPAMMQIRDEMSMLRYRSGNNWSCPMVIRVPIGGYLRGGAPYHSQSGESIFAHCPGIRIAYPVERASTPPACCAPRSAATTRCCSSSTSTSTARPTTRASIPGPDYMIPFGKAARAPRGHRRRRDHLGRAGAALAARGAAGREGRHQRRGARPAHDRAVRLGRRSPRAVKQTNRVVIAHEDQLTCGFGAEIAARIADELFEHLDAPVRRVAALDTPVAYYPDLEEAILPQSADVLKAIQDIARY